MPITDESGELVLCRDPGDGGWRPQFSPQASEPLPSHLAPRTGKHRLERKMVNLVAAHEGRRVDDPTNQEHWERLVALRQSDARRRRYFEDAVRRGTIEGLVMRAFKDKQDGWTPPAVPARVIDNSPITGDRTGGSFGLDGRTREILRQLVEGTCS